MKPIKQALKRVSSSVNLGYRVPLSLEEKNWHRVNDPDWTTIDLPIARSFDGVEEVLVEKIGENDYRIASSPGMVQNLAADDVIRLDPRSPRGYTLRRRGDNVCIHVFCEAARRNEIQAALTQVLGRIGGVLDGTMGQTGLCFTISVLAGFTAIEGALRRVVGDEWTYSNVYDPETNAPLNWWLKPTKTRAKAP